MCIRDRNKFPQLIGSCISETLVDGDGAFKISVDTDLSLYPIIEFYGGERVSYVYKRGRLQEIIFHTSYTQDMADFCLHEHYGRGFIDYKLYNARGDEVELGTVEECISLKPHNTFAGDVYKRQIVTIGEETPNAKRYKWSMKESGEYAMAILRETKEYIDGMLEEW